MHELSITQNMLDIALEHADKADAGKIGKINLVVGEMSGFVADSVRFYFDFLSKGTKAEGASLSFKSVTTKAKCQNCGKTFELKEFDWTCPQCKEDSLEIVAGRELFIESIEVE